MKLEQKRWLILVAGFLANLCQGIAYASSMFILPIMKEFGISKEHKTSASLPFSLIVGCLPIGAIIGGIISNKKGPKTAIAIGSIIFAVGLILASYCVGEKNLLGLYITYGVMLGIGSGMAYGSIVGTVTQWFPDRKGFASGLVVAALGGGPVVLAPIISKLLLANGLQHSFLYLGILFAVIMIGSAFVISAPPQGFKPANSKAVDANKKVAPSAKDFSWVEMIKTSNFWLMFILYVAGTFAGLMVISQAKGLCTEVLEKTKFPGDADALAVLGVQIIAGANAFGRLFWGTVSDKIGRLSTLIIMFAIGAVLMATMNMMSANYIIFLTALLITGLCFGGYLGLFPSICADFFGMKNMSLNYGILFIAFAVSGVTAPIVGTKFPTITGYYVASVIAVVGLALSIYMAKSKKQN